MQGYDIDKQHEKGKLHAIERIELLLDKDSFLEIYSGVKHSCTAFGFENKDIPYDGVITGFGKIRGRTIAIYAQDFTVQGGSLGNMHGKKITELYQKAVEFRCPIIGINDSGGARIQEGVAALAGYGDIFLQNVHASGYIPQISIIAGPCAGGAVYSPGITDFIFIIDKIGYMFITGSKVVKAALKIDITDEQLGGSEIHTAISGVAHFRNAAETDCFEQVRNLLDYIPHYYGEKCEAIKTVFSIKKNKAIQKILPLKSNQGFDVRRLIDCLSDDASFFEIQKDFAQNIVIGFCRMEGRTLGLIANQSNFLGGIANSDASDKAARFIRYCDAFNIPLLSLVDIPGFIPGPDEEKKGIIRHGAKLIFAYAEATVPKVTLIVRKAYGGAYIGMCSKHIGADFVFAWPKAEIAVMGAEGAVQILFSREIAAENETAIHEQLKKYRNDYMNPLIAMEKGYITEVIKPEETRKKISDCFNILQKKQVTALLPKKHGNIPL